VFTDVIDGKNRDEKLFRVYDSALKPYGSSCNHRRKDVSECDGTGVSYRLRFHYHSLKNT
jgi:hypothetical protein